MKSVKYAETLHMPLSHFFPLCQHFFPKCQILSFLIIFKAPFDTSRGQFFTVTH